MNNTLLQTFCYRNPRLDELFATPCETLHLVGGKGEFAVMFAALEEV